MLHVRHLCRWLLMGIFGAMMAKPFAKRSDRIQEDMIASSPLPEGRVAWTLSWVSRLWLNSHGILVWLQSVPEPELSQESKEAFDIAYNNIRRFHEAQRSQPLEVETMPGVKCRRVTRPIGKQSPEP